MRTRMRQLRKQKGMTQAELAKLVGTSQQQLQRVETGGQSIKLELAARIAAVLHVELPEIFPELKGANRKWAKQLDGSPAAVFDPEVIGSFEQAGVDADPRKWYLKVRLRMGAELVLPISGADMNRFWKAMQGRVDANSPFFTFDSQSLRVLLNLKHLLHAHRMFDATTAEPYEPEELPGDEVSVFLSDSPTRLSFSVEPDEDSFQETGNYGVLEYLVAACGDSVEEEEFVRFMDSDGEYVFLRTTDVALMAIPVSAFLDEAEEEDDDDVEGASDSADGP